MIALTGDARWRAVLDGRRCPRPARPRARARWSSPRSSIPASTRTPYLAQARRHSARRRSTAVAAAAGAEGPLHARVEAVNGCLFGELGFRGNRDRYADVRNSCLNQVLDRRTGIPITLAVVYMEVARRAGLRVEGVNFPGHFLVRVLRTARPKRARRPDRRPVPRRRDPHRAGLPGAAGQRTDDGASRSRPELLARGHAAPDVRADAAST